MRGRFLGLMIVLLAALFGELNFVLKHRPSEAEFKQLFGAFGEATRWQGRFAPAFSAPTLQNDVFQLSENVGHKVIVLNFFATWCGPCRQETPELVRYYTQHKNDPFLLVGIDDDEKSDVVKEFVAEYHINYPVLIGTKALERQYGVEAFPTTVAIGVDGRIELYQVGEMQNMDVAFDPYLKISRGMLAQGRAISQDAYLRAVASSSGKAEADGKKVALNEHAEKIAGEMDCPCGCDKKVAACDCDTAKKIKADLAAGQFGKKTDVQIIKALNKKYCMADM